MTPNSTIIAATCAIAAALATPAFASQPTARTVNHQTMYLLRGAQSQPGPDGKGHDAILPANLVLKAGQPVELTIINYDEGPHTITSDQMNLNIMVKPGRQQADGSVKPVTTRYKFTPTNKGVFRWDCRLPCDKGGNFWAMSKGYGGMGQEGFMSGYFVVM